MLYITTRDKADAFTARRTLSSNRGPDGGMFVPFRMPVLEQEKICTMAEQSCSQNIADILNLFFSAGLSGWDVEFLVGRAPAKLNFMNYRICIAENWHNQEWDFAWLVQQLYDRVSGQERNIPSDWFRMAVRIGCLFGSFGELLRNGTVDFAHPMDVAVPSGDFSLPMAVWYARAMGLPIATIICSCNENGGVWDLLHQGQIHTDAVAVSTGLSDADFSVPPHLERLVFGTLGFEENQRYIEICRQGKIFALDEEMSEKLRGGMFAAVVSRKRMESVIHSVYRTTGGLLDPYAAIAFGGLQDYRAKTGESRPALILSEKSPSRMPAVVAAALGMTEAELAERINKEGADSYGSLCDR